jgi:hypothetical protein
MSAPTGNRNAIGNKGGGRKSEYKHSYASQAEKLAKLGLTDVEMATFFEVSEKTINTWKKKHIEFASALKKGKTFSDAEIVDRLFKRALGYKFNEVTFEKIDTKKQLKITSATEIVSNDLYKKKIVKKEIPPDVTAIIFWLKNRQKDKWKDRHEVAGRLDIQKRLESMTDEDLQKLAAEIIKQQENG